MIAALPMAAHPAAHPRSSLQAGSCATNTAPSGFALNVLVNVSNGALPAISSVCIGTVPGDSSGDIPLKTEKGERIQITFHLADGSWQWASRDGRGSKAVWMIDARESANPHPSLNDWPHCAGERRVDGQDLTFEMCKWDGRPRQKFEYALHLIPSNGTSRIHLYIDPQIINHPSDSGT
jgi:hypothetical protein